MSNFVWDPKVSQVETPKHIQKAPAYRAHNTDLEIDLLGFSYNTCRIFRIEPPLELRLFLDLKKERRVQRLEITSHYATGHLKYLFSFSEDWFNVTLDQWVQIHKKGVVTDGVFIRKKVNRTLYFDV